jgi:membrane protease YdiL (CAAX protease family)
MKSVAAAVVLTILLAFAWGWARALRRWRAGESILPLEPRRPVPWGLFDVIFTVFLFLVIQGIALLLVRHSFKVDLSLDLVKMTPSERATVLLSGAVSSLLTAAISLGVIMLRTRAGWSDMGIVARQVASDVRLGVAAFLMLAPPVYAVQMLLVQWLSSQHPLIELLKENPDPLFLAISGFSAVLVAPVAEEYFFRVLVQGWLEKAIAIGRRLPSVPLAENVDDEMGEDEYQVEWDKNLYAPPGPDGVPKKEEVMPNAVLGHHSEGRVLPVPIVTSAAVFAAMHASHGPDPIPLFLLAIGLGYLYQRTHRILPCIVVHFLLNACSLGALTLEIYG